MSQALRAPRWTVLAFAWIAACAATPPPAERRRPDTQPSDGTVLKELPAEVRKELQDRLSSFSDEVDHLETLESRTDEVADPNERATSFTNLAKSYSDLHARIIGILDDAKYAAYRDDPAYGPALSSFQMRALYYDAKVRSLRKKADRATVPTPGLDSKPSSGGSL